MTFAASCIFTFLSICLCAQSVSIKISRYDIYEFKVVSKVSQVGNPFLDVGLSGVFTSPSGKKIRIDGFYDGGDIWKLRFSPNERGIWSYVLKGEQFSYVKQGKLNCTPSSSQGFIGIHPKNPYSFAYHSGLPFFPMGDTSYGLYDDSPVTPELRNAYLATRRSQSFNFIRMEVGHSYSRAAKDPAYWAWGGTAANPDLDRFNPAFFKGFDQLLLQMRQQGMNAELILLNFYRPPFTDPKSWTPAREKQWLRYLIARYSAFSNIFLWTISNEYETHPDGAYRLDNPADVNWIRETAAFIKEKDPYQHLVTVHPVISSGTTGSSPRSPMNGPFHIGGFFGQTKAIDVLSHQTGQGGEGVVWDESCRCYKGDDPVLTESIRIDRVFGKPVINTENGYEYLEGQPTMKNQVHHTDKVRRSSWRIVCSGAYFSAGFTGTLAHSDIWNQIDFPNQYTFILKDEGAGRQLSLLCQFFKALPFWQMKPFSGISGNAVALSNGSSYVAYLPHGGKVQIHTGGQDKYTAKWFDPRNGMYKIAKLKEKGGSLTLQSPDDQDWALLVKRISP
ncbi:MAG TPA: DUF4038 domain-containing protein [Pedobacter sp.]|nr:DUF4038 domain-containing protein [Pedobacter sp.]